MKEEEARKKWCPMFKYSESETMISNNRPPDMNCDGYCIASDCMMWVPESREVRPVEDGFPGNYTHVSGGYCGLAAPKE